VPDFALLDALFERLKIGPLTRNRAHQILHGEPAT